MAGGRSKRLSEHAEAAGEEKLELVRLHAKMELQVQLLQRSAKKLKAVFNSRPVRWRRGEEGWTMRMELEKKVREKRGVHVRRKGRMIE